MLSRVLGNHRALRGVLILTLVLSGCGTSHDLAHPNTAGSTSAAARPARTSSASTQGNLRAALLTARDLPPGYSAQPVSGAGLGSSSITGCPALVNNPNGVSASATVALSDAATGSTVIESLLQMSSQADATAGIAAFATMPTSCRSFSTSVDGFNITLGAAPLRVPAVGDQTTAARMTGTISGTAATIYIDVVVTRHASTLMEILCLGLTADTAFTQHVVHEAYGPVAKLR